MASHMVNVLYVHPAIRNYRKGLFELLSEKGVDFFWSASPKKQEVGKSHSYDEIMSILTDTPIRYRQAKDIHWLPIDNFSWDLFKIPFSNYDVVIFSNITSVPFLLLAPLLRLKKIKIIIFDELWRYPYEVSKYRKIYKYVRFLSKHCLNGVVAAGSKAKEFYMTELDVPEYKIEIAFNTTVDTAQLVLNDTLSQEVKSQIINKTNKKTLLYLGRVVEYKGLDILIRAMVDIDVEFDLIVVGEGDYLDHCKELIKTLEQQERVHFMGACSSELAPYYYKHCDVFVLPTRFKLDSNVQIESWGFTINEAMALETPVITTDAVGSGYDLVLPGITGYLAKAGCHRSLSLSVNKLVGRNQNNILGHQARHHLLNTCNYRDNFNIYMQVIKKVLNEK